MTNSSIFAVGRCPDLVLVKYDFFLLFVLQPNKKLIFAKWHSRVGLSNNASTQYRAFLANLINP